MATITQRTLARNDLPKTVAVEFLATHKTDRTAGELDQKRFGFTDARHLRDGDFFFSSRLSPGYRLEEHAGARNPPGPGQLILPPGTGLKGGTEPNRLTFTLNNKKDPAGRTLGELRDYELVGAEIIAFRGAERDGAGNAHDFADYVEVFFGYIETVDTGTEEIRIRATSPEGWHAGNFLGRRTFLGLGSGVDLDNTGGPSVAWMAGTSPSAFAPTSGAWAASSQLLLLELPPTAGTILSYGTRVVVQIVEDTGDHFVEVTHHDGVSPTTFRFSGFPLDASIVEEFIALGVRHDAAGSTLSLYLDTVLVDTVATTKDPTTDATVLTIGRDDAAADPLSAIFYELWISDDDPGDSAMRARQAGPLVYDRPSQGDLFDLYPMLEGGISPAVTVTADLVFDGAENDLTLFGTAAFSDSEEGDKPDVNPEPRGRTKPFVLGHVFSFPPTPRSRAGIADDDAVYETAPWKLRLDAARDNGSSLSVAFLKTAVFRFRDDLGPNGESAIESPDLARVVFPPVIDETGVQLSHGSDLEISGGHAEDGVWYVTKVTGGRFVFVNDGAFPPAGFSAEDLSASATITVPPPLPGGRDAAVANGTDGSLTTRDSLGGQLAVDVERKDGPTPTATASAIFLRNARDRAENATIDQVSFTDNHDVTVVGPTGELDRPWSLGIVGGADITFRTAEAELLESFFAFSTDTARVDIDPGPGVILAQGIRMGQYRPPDLAAVAADHAFSEQQVDESTIRQLATLSPAWSVTVLYRKNYSPIEHSSIPSAVSPAVRNALSSEYSRIEVFRDPSIRVDFPNARQVEWRTNFFDVETAILVGERVAAFLKVPRTWWSFRLDTVRPERILIGEDLSVAHERFNADASPLAFIALGKGSGITKRGVDLVAVS